MWLSEVQVVLSHNPMAEHWRKCKEMQLYGASSCPPDDYIASIEQITDNESIPDLTPRTTDPLKEWSEHLTCAYEWMLRNLRQMERLRSCRGAVRGFQWKDQKGLHPTDGYPLRQCREPERRQRKADDALSQGLF